MQPYDEWYSEIAGLVTKIDLPEVYVEECLTNRDAMHQLHQEGYAAAEVVMHLRKQYRLLVEENARRETMAAARVDAEEKAGMARQREEEWKGDRQFSKALLILLVPVAFIFLVISVLMALQGSR